MDDILALAEKLTAELPHGQRLGCTGVAAAWCPHHGDCICIREHHLDQQDDCPLHGGVDDPFTVLQIGLVTGPRCEYPGCGKIASQRTGPYSVCKYHSGLIEHKEYKDFYNL